ncbi:TadG family pilus assembly protein [Sphingopyxis sp.]|uniref:TadG family pilus assembly protein n=1 Tax=Sphingopyxis sp. TaxID=1908224 RepID=UPI002D790281|nr:TadG family pilus assembly protein [Sphingopyxis sp.]HET6526249.1 TadG family pilus assembly protein [Sphingopyxis sp.]
MARPSFLRRLVRSRRASISITTAFGMAMLIGSAAFAVDLGSLYLDRRKLQGIADAAAMAAAGRPGEELAAAERIIAANCDCGIEIAALTPGTYAADPSVQAELRFTGGGASPNAIRITLMRDRPLFFGSFLTGRQDSIIRATATGARRGYAAFSLGSRVAALNGGLPNALLSSLTGSEVNLSVMDYNALASTDIDLLAFSDALRTELDADVLTFGQTLNTQATLPQVVSALASASDGQAASALEHIADSALPRALLPSRAIDLGPRSSSIRIDAANPVKVNALSLLRTMLLLGNANRQVDLSLAGSLPGGSGVDIALLVGEPPADSPLIAVTDTNDVIVRTAQVRLKVDTRVSTPLASVHVPLLAELGSASARITDIDCAPNSNAAVSLGVVTSPAMVAIGTVPNDDFQDMQRQLDPQPARVVKLPLVSVDARAELTLSDLDEKPVAFSRSEIDEGRVKTVSSTGLVAGAAGSLADDMELDVNVLGLGLNLKALTNVVGETVALAAPVLDSVLSDLTGLLGLQVGQADTRVNALRCGKARLV